MSIDLPESNEEVEANWNFVSEDIKKSKDENKNGESKETNIQVAVRVRPLNQKEAGQRSVVIVQDATVILDENADDEDGNRATSAGALTASSAPASFTYDYAFDEKAGQADIFKVFGRDMVKDVILGFNCSVFAYGQTSSGKSYTMTGSDDQKGLIPRICECLFFGIDKMKAENKTFRIQASYYEIYNEKVYDLLNPMGLELGDNDDDDVIKRKPLNVREDKKVGVFVDGLLHADVDSVDEANEVMSRGLRERTVQATKMNSVSSRSHAIFVLSIAQTLSSEEKTPPGSPRSTSPRTTDEGGFKKKVPKPKSLKSGVASSASKRILDKKNAGLKPLKASTQSAKQMNMRSRLSLIDLAGSERSKTSGAEGGRLTESNNINLSLSTLGRCISALVKKAKGGGKNMVIPFRDSVLTWLLRESLAGNARTRMMASVSPALINAKETISTLRYARSAKMITTKATVIQDPKEQRINFLASEVERLKSELSAFQASNDASSGNGGSFNNEDSPRPFNGSSGPRTHRLGSMYGGNTVELNLSGSSLIGSGSNLKHLSSPALTPKPKRSFAQTGAVMAELMHELELLTTNEQQKRDNRVSVDIPHDHLYVPATTYDLKQVRKLWRNKKYENVPIAVISNLNADPLLTGKLLLHLKGGSIIKIGRPGATMKQDLELEADGILTEHCIIEYLTAPTEKKDTHIIHDAEEDEEEEGNDEAVVAVDPEQLFIEEENEKWNQRTTPKTPQAYITPLRRDESARLSKSNYGFGDFEDEFLHEIDEIAEVHVNGKRVMSRQAIHHGDRLVFGACTYAGLFVECPKILKAKLEKEQEELDHKAEHHPPGFEHVVHRHTKIDMVEAMRKSENLIDKAKYTEALHEVLRASVAKANSLRRTLSMAPSPKLGGVVGSSSSLNQGQSQDNQAPSNGKGSQLSARNASFTLDEKESASMKKEESHTSSIRGVHFQEGSSHVSSERKRDRSPDRRGQEVSADLMFTHGAVRQTNFIARELGLGLVFSIVLKSDVNSHVALGNTDIDDLLTWKNVTVNVEATCYLPASDDGSDSESMGRRSAFRPLTEPHHLLTCTAEQFGDIAEVFNKARSLLKRCVRRVSTLIKHSKAESAEMQAMEALEQVEVEEVGDERPLNQILSERVDSRSEDEEEEEEEEEEEGEDDDEGEGDNDEEEESENKEEEEGEKVKETKEEKRLRKEKKKLEKEARKEQKRKEKEERKEAKRKEKEAKKQMKKGAEYLEKQASTLPNEDEEGVMRKVNQGSGWNNSSGASTKNTNNQSSNDEHEPNIWAESPAGGGGRFDRHSFSVSRPDVDAALQDERILSPSLARGGSVARGSSMARGSGSQSLSSQSKKALHILKRVFNALYEANIDEEGRVSHHDMSEEEAFSAYAKQKLNPSQVALGLCMLGMMESTRGIKLRLRQAERFMGTYNSISNMGAKNTKKKNEDAYMPVMQHYDSFAYGIVEHIRLCVIGAVLEDVVYELTESSPAVLRAFLTRSPLTHVSIHDIGEGSSQAAVVSKPVAEATSVALSQMEERAVRAEKMLEDQRNRSEGLFEHYNSLRNTALTRFMGDMVHSNETISSAELLSHFKTEDQMSASEEWEVLIGAEAETLEVKHQLEEAKFEKKEAKLNVDHIMLKMKALQKDSQDSHQLAKSNEEDLSSYTYDLVVAVTKMKDVDDKIEKLSERISSLFEQKATASENLLLLSAEADDDVGSVRDRASPSQGLEEEGEEEDHEDHEVKREKKKKHKKDKHKKEKKRAVSSVPLDKALQTLRNSFEADPEATVSSFFGRGIRI